MPTVGALRADFDSLLRAIGSLAELRDLEALRHHTVAVILSLLPTDAVAWNEVDPQRGLIEAVMEPDLYSEESVAAFMKHVGDHPLISRYNATVD